jgi:hypothetical protein
MVRWNRFRRGGIGGWNRYRSRLQRCSRFDDRPYFVYLTVAPYVASETDTAAVST